MTTKAFVIGHPIAHSKSPLIHEYWLKALEIDGSYEAIDVLPDDLGRFFERMRQGAFIGGNVTIPHKQTALQFCDTVAEVARRIGAINTVQVQDGQIHGSNTDMIGFLANLDGKAPDWDTQKRTCMVLGAGGAARAVLVALHDRGFENIYVLNRTLETAQRLCAELKGPFHAHALADFAKLAAECTLLVNTTSIGMHGTAFAGLDLSKLPASALVTDIVYTPLQTPLLRAATAIGLQTVDGLGMLLHQAVPGFEGWFGQRPRITPDLRALVEKAIAP